MTSIDALDAIGRRCPHGIGIRYDDHFGVIVFEIPDPDARPQLEDYVLDPTRAMPARYGPWPIVVSRATVDEAIAAFAAALPEEV